MRMTPRLNRTGKTSPMAASSFTCPVLLIVSTRAAVSRPVSAAATMRNGECRLPTTKTPITMPGRMA
jgi:hypothetical protein